MLCRVLGQEQNLTHWFCHICYEFDCGQHAVVLLELHIMSSSTDWLSIREKQSCPTCLHQQKMRFLPSMEGTAEMTVPFWLCKLFRPVQSILISVLKEPSASAWSSPSMVPTSVRLLVTLVYWYPSQTLSLEGLKLIVCCSGYLQTGGWLLLPAQGGFHGFPGAGTRSDAAHQWYCCSHILFNFS